MESLQDQIKKSKTTITVSEAFRNEISIIKLKKGCRTIEDALKEWKKLKD